MKDLIIVIPVYKKTVSLLESISMNRVSSIFFRHEVCFVFPEGLDISEPLRIIPRASYEPFPAPYFRGFDGYNQLMMSEVFYTRFLDYEYILICQQDTYIFYDALDRYLDLGYDFTGAPIPKMDPWESRFRVGNGGFSLRKVKSVIRLLTKHKEMLRGWRKNEDHFFSQCAEDFPEEFAPAPLSEALLFSFDTFPMICLELNGHKKPMAVHGWHRGDTSFAEKYILPELGEELVFSEGVTFAERIKEYYDFLEVNDKFVFWGSGDAAHIFYEISKEVGKKPTCFLVSDDQSIRKSFEKTDVLHFSECHLDLSQYSAFIAVNRRYRKTPDFEILLRQRGVKNVLWMTNDLFMAGANECLKKAYSVSSFKEGAY